MGHVVTVHKLMTINLILCKFSIYHDIGTVCIQMWSNARCDCNRVLARDYSKMKKTRFSESPVAFDNSSVSISNCSPLTLKHPTHFYQATSYNSYMHLHS